MFSCVETPKVNLENSLEKINSGADKILDVVDKITDIDSISIIIQDSIDQDGVITPSQQGEIEDLESEGPIIDPDTYEESRIKENVRSQINVNFHDDLQYVLQQKSYNGNIYYNMSGDAVNTYYIDGLASDRETFYGLINYNYFWE